MEGEGRNLHQRRLELREAKGKGASSLGKRQTDIEKNKREEKRSLYAIEVAQPSPENAEKRGDGKGLGSVSTRTGAKSACKGRPKVKAFEGGGGAGPSQMDRWEEKGATPIQLRLCGKQLGNKMQGVLINPDQQKSHLIIWWISGKGAKDRHRAQWEGGPPRGRSNGEAENGEVGVSRRRREGDRQNFLP